MPKIEQLLILIIFSSLVAAQGEQAKQVCQKDNILPTAPTTRYQLNGDGTVNDKETGLMWRLCLEGITGKACDGGKPIELTWANALLYAPKLNNEGGFAGHKDWRLPNIRELTTLAELQCINPAINKEVFLNAPVSQVWSSSPYHFYTHYSWYLDFGRGMATYDERIRYRKIRIVRDDN